MKERQNRGVEIEILENQPVHGDFVAASTVKPRGHRPGRARLVVALVGVTALAFTVANLTGRGGEVPVTDASPDLPVIPEPRPAPVTEIGRESGYVFPGIAPDGESSNPYPIPGGVGGEKLFALADPELFIVFDLETGSSEKIVTPEPMVGETPVVVNGTLVAIGETGAWLLRLGAEWSLLGQADQVRPSSLPGRVWLRVTEPEGSPSEFRWREVDLDGVEYRSQQRNAELQFATPELVWGMEGDIFRFTEDPVVAWELISPRAYPAAIGLNDLVSRECNMSLECRRQWYDATTGEERPPIFADLAINIDVRFGALLSNDGRFVAQEAPDGGVEIYRVANRIALVNDCFWGQGMAWTANSAILACETSLGIMLYDLAAGSVLGLAIPNDTNAGAFTIGATEASDLA